MTRTEKKLKVRKLFKKDFSVKAKYKTTYSEIKIKQIKDRQFKCWGQVCIYEWKRKGTRQYHLEMLPEYPTKKDFVDTLGHEMVHLYQMANVGDSGNHNALFYSFKPKLKQIGLNI
jgi:hypothetical protein